MLILFSSFFWCQFHVIWVFYVMLLYIVIWSDMILLLYISNILNNQIKQTSQPLNVNKKRAKMKSFVSIIKLLNRAKRSLIVL